MARFKLFVFFIFCFLSFASFAITKWQTLAPGLSYTELHPQEENSWGNVHAFKINLEKYRLVVALSRDHQRRTSTVRQLAELNNALIAINGGFFTPDLRPIGLRINNGKVEQHLKETSWWGVFYTSDQKAEIVSQRNYHFREGTDFAVQGGPRLVTEGNIPRLKPGFAERTALGITKQGEVILLVTHRSPLTTTSLAELMQRSNEENGLDCYNALNLDGGSSTQMYAHVEKFELYVPGFSSITDAVLVKQRS